MTKYDFLKELLEYLAPLPEAEREKAYAFYAEMIDDSIEDGMTEEQAVQRLGDMQDIVDHIIAEMPMSVIIKSSVRRKRKGFKAMLWLVCGFPIWFPALMLVISLLLLLFILLWVMVPVLWSVFAAFAAAAAGGCVGLFLYPGLSAKLLLLGGAMASGGLAIPLFLLSLRVTKQIARLTKRIWIQIKNSIFRKRGHAK